MATILQSKGHDVITARVTDSIIDVSRILHKHGIGAVIVRDEDGHVAGLASERDIVAALGDRGATSLDAPISDVMSRKLVVCEPHHDMGYIMACMTDRRVRHLPVLENGELIGIITLGDVVKARIFSLESESETMREYIAGREWRYHHKVTGVQDVAALRQELGNN